MDEILGMIEKYAEEKLTPYHRNILGPALKTLRENKDAMEYAGEEAVREFLRLIQGGMSDEAKRHFIKHLATPNDLIEGMEESAEEIEEATDWDALVDGIVGGITKIAAGLVLSCWRAATT